MRSRNYYTVPIAIYRINFENIVPTQELLEDYSVIRSNNIVPYKGFIHEDGNFGCHDVSRRL